MKDLKSHFVFNKSQRNGIFLLVIIICVLQLIYFFTSRTLSPPPETEDPQLIVFQQKIDSVKLATKAGDTLRIFPFNPNFLTDYRGYTLGMSIEEIDRLHQFRAQEKWVNTAKDFQEVTGINDSLLEIITPYFRFPEWVTNARRAVTTRPPPSKQVGYHSKQDLNAASVDDLIQIRGIGETLANRIVNYRNRIGGFQDDIQLKDIYGLNFETREEVIKNFTVKNAPKIEILNINTASVVQLSEIPYINYELAREIVNYRLLNEGIRSFEELAKIREFPSEKIDRIALYLTLE
ncbi:helix-hairpin-helix domain-containing protein [soil metagenome]